MNTRVMVGVADLSGQRVNNLRIGAMVARHPLPRYETVCERCGAKSMVGQRDIATGKARCLAAGCGNDKLREYLNDSPRKAAERDAQRKRAVLSAAEEHLKQTYRQLNAVVRERLTGRVRDSDRIPIDPAVAGITMTLEEAAQFNRGEFRKYRDTHPEIYWTPELVEQLGRYFDANGLQIVTAAMLGRLIERFREAGLLPDAPELQNARVPEPVEESEQPSGPEVHIGRDWQTGEKREYTEREVNRMSSEEFKRAFPIAPTFRDFFDATEHP